jgi:hypothetical protein
MLCAASPSPSPTLPYLTLLSFCLGALHSDDGGFSSSTLIPVQEPSHFLELAREFLPLGVQVPAIQPIRCSLELVLFMTPQQRQSQTLEEFRSYLFLKSGMQAMKIKCK